MISDSLDDIGVDTVCYRAGFHAGLNEPHLLGRIVVAGQVYVQLKLGNSSGI